MVSCSNPGGIPPSPERIDPPEANTNQGRLLTIHGEDFASSFISNIDDGTLRSADEFRVQLRAGDQVIELDAVRQLSDSTLEGSLQAGTLPGIYDAIVIGPLSQSGALADAFKVFSDLDEDEVHDDEDDCVDIDGDGLGREPFDTSGCLDPTPDSDDEDPMVCADTDDDGCDDCSSGSFQPQSDGCGMPGSQIRLLGSESCQGLVTTVSLTDTVPAGNVVMVQVSRDSSLNNTTIADSQGHTWTALDVNRFATQTFLFQTTVTTPFGPGDTITVTQDGSAETVVFVADVSGLTQATSFLSMADGETAAMQVDFTLPADGILVCSLGARAGSIDNPIADWNQLVHTNIDCGGSNGLIAGGLYWLPASAGISSCVGNYADIGFPIGWVGAVTHFAP